MLGHVRSKTLDEFKAALTKALESGKAFAVASCDCTQSFMSAFDEGCKGTFFEVSCQLFFFFFQGISCHLLILHYKSIVAFQLSHFFAHMNLLPFIDSLIFFLYMLDTVVINYKTMWLVFLVGDFNIF